MKFHPLSSLVILFCLFSLFGVTYPGYTQENINTTEEKTTIAKDPSDSDSNLIQVFNPFFSVGIDGGINFHMNAYYKRHFSNGPRFNGTFRFFPPFFENKPILEYLTFIGNISYLYGKRKIEDPSATNAFSIHVGGRMDYPIIKAFFTYGTLGIGYYLNTYKIESLDTYRIIVSQGFSARVTAGVGYTFFERLDVTLGLQYLVNFDKAFPQYAYNTLSINVGAAWRFEKPTPRITIEEVSIPSLFAALAPYYAQTPVVHVHLKNDSGVDVSKVRVAIFIPDYMDGPTQSRLSISKMDKDAEEDVQLPIVFSRKIMELTNTAPVTAHIQVSYFVDKKKLSVSSYIPVTIQHRNALTWDDDNKLASFITPIDPSIQSFASQTVNAVSQVDTGLYSDKITEAVAIYQACTLHGLSYVRDPTSPVPGNQNAIDFIKYPTEFLQLKTGDCDDLTALYCSLLESIGIETAFVTVPGHIFVLFNSEVHISDVKTVTKDPDRIFSLDDTVWIPIEVTAIGRKSFSTAWKWASEQINRWQNTDAMVIHRTREAQLLFPPAPFPKEDHPEFHLPKDQLIAQVEQELLQLTQNAIIDTEESLKQALAENPNDKEAYNRLGVIYAKRENWRQAEASFKNALDIDEDYYIALLNLAKVYINMKDYDRAETLLQRCIEIDPTNFLAYLAMGLVMKQE